MRVRRSYAYDGTCAEYVERTYNAFHNIDTARANHHIGSEAVAASCWFYAADTGDFGDTIDHVLETYPITDAIYKVIIAEELPHHPDVSRHPLWDVYDKVTDEAIFLENRIYIAAVVVNAIVALEGYTEQIWGQTERGLRWEEAFKIDRDDMDHQIRFQFAEWVSTDAEAGINQEVNTILQHSNEWFERRKREAREEWSKKA